MVTEHFVRQLFEAVDNRQADRFAQSFEEDGQFRFGNMPAVTGIAAIHETVSGFFGAIAGISHLIEDVWAEEDATICHGEVTYTRQDGSKLQVPFAVIMNGEDGAIAEYLIFVDNSALFAN